MFCPPQYWKLNLGHINFETTLASPLLKLDLHASSPVPKIALPYWMILTVVFNHFKVPIHHSILVSCKYIDIGTVKLKRLSAHDSSSAPGSSFAPPGSSSGPPSPPSGSFPGASDLPYFLTLLNMSLAIRLTTLLDPPPPPPGSSILVILFPSR